MKNNVMILIFCIFFLSRFIAATESYQNNKYYESLDSHHLYLSKLTAPLCIISTIQINNTLFKKVISRAAKEASYNSVVLRECIQKIQLTMSLKPLFNIWHMLNSYHFMDDYELKKELCIFILLFYKNALTYLYDTEKRFLLEQINIYYQNIHSKELHELLEILNIVAQEIKPLLELMATNAGTTWKEWFAKYWFPIIVTCVTIVIKIMIYEKKSEKETVIWPNKKDVV